MPNVDIDCDCGRTNTVWITLTGNHNETTNCKCGRTFFYKSPQGAMLESVTVSYEIGELRLK